MHPLLFEIPPEQVIRVLEPYLTDERIARIETVVNRRINGVHVAVEAPYDMHNGFAIVRTAEALGVSHIHMVQADMKKRRGRSITRGTLKWTHLLRHDSLESFLESKGDRVLAGACVDGDTPLEDIPLDRPVCFLFGNENEGLSAAAKQHCDVLYRIPIYGMVESYNLSVAAAITLYDALNRKRAQLGCEGDLTKEEYLEEKALFYVRSIGAQTAQQLLIPK